MQNLQVWKTYATALERVADDMSKGPPIDSDEPRWATREKVMKPEVPGTIGGALFGPVLEFHSTSLNLWLTWELHELQAAPRAGRR